MHAFFFFFLLVVFYFFFFVVVVVVVVFVVVFCFAFFNLCSKSFIHQLHPGFTIILTLFT